MIAKNRVNNQVKNKELLKKALTHTSYAYEHSVESNEKLEFLGDSILEFISSTYLFEKYSDRPIFTRTWSTNLAHIKILEKFGF